MGSVKSINTENFSFTITGLSADGMGNTVEIKPLTPAAKDLFRFKKYGRKTSVEMPRGEIFNYADSYEAKVMQLAGI
jgi:hypothetical protein